LQGAASQESFKLLVEYFSTQRFYHPMDPIQSYAAAASLYRRCRQKGITIRSSIDCLIAQVAIEHRLLLLHSDRDYVAMQTVLPELRFFSE
jgi:predicted nucleic acid-binding protein